MNWTFISTFGKSRVVRSSYYWLFFVPLVAKLVHQINLRIPAQVLNQDILFEFNLPFSWKVFYFSSLFFAAGTLIYQAFCPKIIKDHKNAADFIRAGKGKEQLLLYAEDIKINPSEFELYNEAHEVAPTIEVLFWRVREKAEDERRLFKNISLFFNLAGIALFSVVLLQNFMFVLSFVIGSKV